MTQRVRGDSDRLAYLTQLRHKREASISCMRPFMGSDKEKKWPS